jgi:indole-3-glycerol phosphate synthase/phosphoribosylanthranilate isomerase
MANILEKIVQDKREEIATLAQQKPLASFINDIVPSNKDFYGAISRKVGHSHAGFILECKKASPSKGLIRPDFDIKAISKIYDKYAAAISVLTDQKYFQGNYDYLQTVTSQVKCPVLNKDFFISEYQVYLARYYGADAILLMLSVLDDQQYNTLSTLAASLNLAVLTEISNEQERDRAIALNAKLIGINNRNLRDLSTDISQTFNLAPSIPDDRIVISESGIYTNAQVRELAPAVDGFLVGSSLMAEDDIDLACRKLIFGHQKVCGLRTAEDAQQVKQAGAEYAGLIFAEKSPRFVTTEQAREITSSITGLNYVGVFVDHPVTDVAEKANSLGLSAVQLHGNESQEYIEQCRKLLNKPCEIWKAIPVTNSLPAFDYQVDRILLDGKSPGSGESFNWQLLNNAEVDLSSCLLAGGLNNDNIQNALNLLVGLELYGLDINSGVEQSVGVKSADKIQQIFAQIRQY